MGTKSKITYTKLRDMKGGRKGNRYITDIISFTTGVKAVI